MRPNPTNRFTEGVTFQGVEPQVESLDAGWKSVRNCKASEIGQELVSGPWSVVPGRIGCGLGLRAKARGWHPLFSRDIGQTLSYRGFFRGHP